MPQEKPKKKLKRKINHTGDVDFGAFMRFALENETPEQRKQREKNQIPLDQLLGAINSAGLVRKRRGKSTRGPLGPPKPKKRK